MKIKLNTDVCPIITPDTYGTGFQDEIEDACWNDFKESLCDIGAKYIKEAIRKTKDFAKCPVTVSRNLVSPRQYNYRTDSIDFNVYVDDKLIETLKNDRVSEQFLKYIKKFGSHSGFISNYSTTENEVKDAFMDVGSNKFDLLIAEFIMYEVEYMLDLDKYQQDFIDDVSEKAFDNGYVEIEDLAEGISIKKAVNKILEGANVNDTISNVSLTERSMSTKERMIEVVLPNEEPFFIILSVPGNMKNPKGYIQNWVRTHLPSNADWDYSESRKVNGCKISESSEEKYAFMNDIIDKIVSMDADDFVLNYVDTSDKEKLVNYV